MKRYTVTCAAIAFSNESIVGDYAKMNTLDESYFVKTNYKSKKVKAILEKTDE